MTGVGNATDHNVETEWQFEVLDLEPVRAWLESQPEHAPLRFTLRKDGEQVDSYYDTADWRLFFAGYSLRRRRRDESYEVTLKSLERAADGPISRREINEASPDGQMPGDHGPVSDRVRTIAGRAGLERLFEVRTRRRSYAVEQDGLAVAQVELDETTVAPHSAPATTFRRVEVEMAGGPPSLDVESFVQAMRYANALTPTKTSKFEAGLEAASLDPSATLDFGSQQRDPQAGAAEFAYACLREQWAAFLGHAPGTRLGEDIEALHQMRVATRRLRATIRVFDNILPPAFEELRAELQWVGHELGAVRDLDVQIEGLEALRAGATWEDAAALRPLIEVIEGERREERLRLIELLDSDRYQALVAACSSELRQGAPFGTPAPEIGAFAKPILERRFERVRRDGKRLNDRSPSGEYHALRIRGKRLRYSLEVFGELYGRPAQRVTGSLKALQDMLGDHQDAEVGIERLRGIVARHGRTLPPETLVAIGTLSERYRQRESALRSEFPRDFERLLERWRPLARAIDEAARPHQPRASTGQDTDSDGPDAEAEAGPATPAPASSVPLADGAARSTSEIAMPRTDAPEPAEHLDDHGVGSLSRMRQLFHRD